MAAEQEITEPLSFDGAVSKGRRSTVGTVLWLLTFFAIAVGLGYYALQLTLERDAVRKALTAARGQVAQLHSLRRQQGTQIGTLTQERTDSAALLSQANANLAEVNAELAAARTRLDELDAQRSEIADQLAEFKAMTAQLKSMIDSGRLTVNFRRGRMIVELPAQVLFPSGSADLTKEGREALLEVAKILRAFKNRHFIVAGHTDNVPVAGRFANNWELSSARAVNVTSELVRGGLRPEQLVAAGYSEYDPIARNTNEKGKQKNRRIEIILEPRLHAIPGVGPKQKK